MSQTKRVLITGAAGRIGSSLAEQLRDRYDLRLHYNRTVPAQPPVSDYVIADIARYEQVAPIMRGMDAVVHMAGEPSVNTPWERIREANIVGAYNVFEAARAAGVGKIVFASTNHVMGMYDRDGQWPIYANQPVRPDSLYGVSKAFGENLGRHEADQSGLAVICRGIGWFLRSRVTRSGCGCGSARATAPRSSGGPSRPTVTTASTTPSRATAATLGHHQYDPGTRLSAGGRLNPMPSASSALTGPGRSHQASPAPTRSAEYARLLTYMRLPVHQPEPSGIRE
jgi:hypothetical protein